MGPNAYAELSLYFVNQMEIALTLAGFYGGNTFGFTPRLSVERLWSKDWGIAVAFNWMHLRPLKSFVNEIPAYLRIYEERKSDVLITLHYRLDKQINISAEFLFADRTYEVEEKIYSSETYGTRTLFCRVRFRIQRNHPDVCHGVCRRAIFALA